MLWGILTSFLFLPQRHSTDNIWLQPQAKKAARKFSGVSEMILSHKEQMVCGAGGSQDCEDSMFGSVFIESIHIKKKAIKWEINGSCSRSTTWHTQLSYMEQQGDHTSHTHRKKKKNVKKMKTKSSSKLQQSTEYRCGRLKLWTVAELSLPQLLSYHAPIVARILLPNQYTKEGSCHLALNVESRVSGAPFSSGKWNTRYLAAQKIHTCLSKFLPGSPNHFFPCPKTGWVRFCDTF